MQCEVCKKNKKLTFHRVGGEIDPARFKRAGGPEIRGWNSVCLFCIEKKMADREQFIQAPILKNPTIAPTGDPAEWILNE